MHLSNIKSYQQKYTMNFKKLLRYPYIKFSKTTIAIRFNLPHFCPISCAIFTFFNVLSSYFYVSQETHKGLNSIP